jgi:hypothetical protein
VLLWHIREGLNVAMLGSFVGNVWAEHSDAFAAAFLDERADEKQREALQIIFGGQAGGWPATFGEIFGAEIRGMEYVTIDVFIAEDLATWSVDILGKATATVEALTGPTTPEGARVQVHNLPGAAVVAVEKMNRHGETISLVLGGLLVVLAICLFVEPGVLPVVS